MFVVLLFLRRRHKLAKNAQRDIIWNENPELPAKDVAKREHIAEENGEDIREMVAYFQPQALEPEVLILELPAHEGRRQET